MKFMDIKQLKLLLMLMQLILIGNAAAQKTDKAGSQDHPLLSRFEGFIIDSYEVAQFDRYRLPIGLALNRKTLGDTTTLEGKVTKIHYAFFGKEGAPSLFQIFKSYEELFAEKSAEVVYSCFKSECGKGAKNLVVASAVSKQLLNGFMQFGEHAYTAVKLEQESKQIYIALYVRQERDRVAYELHFVELTKMNTGQISMADIQKGIEDTGKQVFYGLYFDTGKSSLQESAKAELALLATFLKNNQERAFFIVGHTDNTGNYQSNLRLSKARANSVVKELKEEQGINTKNIIPIGIGPVSPMVNNNSEVGRAKNRRVELVLK
jgi:outer membrane protein OmpA-like peptidoglycan-associated protein